MDLGVRNRLHELLEDLTESGDTVLDTGLVTEVKSIVKKSNENMGIAYEFLFSQLRKEHAQIRYSCLLLSDVLFTRAKNFRALLVGDFKEFVDLVIGPKEALPKPINVAVQLRAKGLALINEWHKKFGKHYKQLELAHTFLNSTLKKKKKQFAAIDAAAAREETERQAREQRTKELFASKYRMLRDARLNMAREIKASLEQLHSCIAIVLPNLFGAKDLLEEAVDDGSNADDDGLHGFGHAPLSIAIDLKATSATSFETTENTAVFDNLRDLFRVLVKRHEPAVKEALYVLSKADVTEIGERDAIFKEMLDLSNSLKHARAECAKVNVTQECLHHTADSPRARQRGERSRGSVLASSPSAATSPFSTAIPKGQQKRMGNDAKKGKLGKGERKRLQPVGAKSPSLSVAGKGGLHATAPVMPFYDCLRNWGADSIDLNQTGFGNFHRWIGGQETTDDRFIKPSFLVPVDVSSTPKPVKWACRFPLKDGTLCPRKDRQKCPLHGLVVGRDESGRPAGTEVVQASGKRKRKCEDEEETTNKKKKRNEEVECAASRPPVPTRLSLEGLRAAGEDEGETKKEKKNEGDDDDDDDDGFEDVVVDPIALGLLGGNTPSVEREKKQRSRKATKKSKKKNLVNLSKQEDTVKKRLARRLLSARAVKRTKDDLNRRESESIRNRTVNRFH